MTVRQRSRTSRAAQFEQQREGRGKGNDAQDHGQKPTAPQRLRQAAAPAAELALRLIEAYWSGCQQWSRLGVNMGRIALYHMSLNPLAVGDKLQDAIRALSDFVDSYQVLPDILNANNLMVRKDGTLVFSDPVFIA